MRNEGMVDVNINKILSQGTKVSVVRNNNNSNDRMCIKKDMLEIPQILETASSIYSMPKVKRTRKHRLLEQKNTEIERSNRILYEKIRKIMIKGRNSQKNILVEGKEEELEMVSKSVNKEEKKILHLPAISERSKSFSLRSINEGVQNIPIVHDKKQSMIHQKYLRFISKQRIAEQILTDSEQLGSYRYGDWSIRVELINNGEYLLIHGIKDGQEREIIKRYKYGRVVDRIGGRLEEWVVSKFKYE